MNKVRVAHPFLFPLFPILALYAHNVRSLPIPLIELAGALAASLACAGALFVLLRAALGQAAKAGLLVSLTGLWIFSFGHVAGRIAVWTGGLFNRSFFFATAILAGLAGLWIVRSRRTFSGLSRILNSVSALLVVFNLVSIGLTAVRRPGAAADSGIAVATPAKARPDIYYLVFDAYPRADVLREVFSFDNSGFLAGLETRGFYIASKSLSNYGFTYHSLASSLNLEYLDEVARQAGAAAYDQAPLYRMIQTNRAMRFLKGQGYSVMCLSSDVRAWDARAVDRQVFNGGPISDFLSALLNTTPAPLFINLADRSSYANYRKQALVTLETLGRSPRGKGPFFVFAHLPLPHPPFVFGPGGEAVDPDYLFSRVDADRLHGSTEAGVRDYIVRFRDQIAFLNTKILKTVDAILSSAPAPPIIILQGDHGSRAYADLDRPEACYLKENLAVLNAYRLPGDGQALLYPEISPVNTFRLIFKHYFGADLDLLEDRSAWCAWWRPYVFIPYDAAADTAAPASIRGRMKPHAPVVQERQQHRRRSRAGGK